MAEETAKEPVKPGEQVQFDYLFKILLSGSAGSGKTAFLSRLTSCSFTEFYQATIGVDFAIKVGTMLNTKFKLQIWDTAGQEKFRNLTTSYFRGAHAICVFVDLTSDKAKEEIVKHLTDAKNYGSSECIYLVIGSKSDLPGRTITKEELASSAETFSAEYIEMSSKTFDNVYSAMEKLVQKLLKNKGNVPTGHWWSKPKFEWATQK